MINTFLKQSYFKRSWRLIYTTIFTTYRKCCIFDNNVDAYNKNILKLHIKNTKKNGYFDTRKHANRYTGAVSAR